MVKVISVLALVFVLGVPSMAAAADRLVLVQQSEATSNNEVDPQYVLAVGAGVVVGALAISSVFNFQGAGLVGAVAGGLLADLWYGERHDYAELELKK